MKVISAILRFFLTKNFARAVARILAAVLVLFSVNVVCFGLLHPDLNFTILILTFIAVLEVVDDRDSDDDDDEED